MENNQNQIEQQPSGTPIRKEITVGKITVDDVHIGDFQKEGTLTAQLRQVITTKSFYPSKKVDSNMQDNVFGTDEFGFTEQEFVSVENRVAFMDVPVGTTKEQVQTKLDGFSKANLYRVMSNKPILTDNQNYAISQNLRTMEQFAETQVVRYPEGTTKNIGGTDVDVSGNIVLDKNEKVQYRRVFFYSTGKADQDLRTADKTDVYLTPEIEAELTGASTLANQSI